ncbi:hypothetical protein [Streptomyces sp. SID2888]|uniref:hypothetical protein n=1 Tax=Streptomyces sp. SID2888 TaxID=2690256 RepID=UPI0019258186|nr:hypothetical protein [Streptomyces sp. SID2888]
MQRRQAGRRRGSNDLLGGGQPDIADYRGSDLFSPRDLATPLAALIASGVPPRAVPLGR